jgi:hypothetical protein
MLDPFDILEANGNKPNMLPLSMWFVSGCFDEYVKEGIEQIERYARVMGRIEQEKRAILDEVEWED